MKVLIDVAPSELPAQFQPLVDPDAPLKNPARFAPEPRDGGFLAHLIGALCAAGIVLLVISVIGELRTMSRGGEYSAPNLGLGLAFAAVLTWWGGRQVRFIQRGRAQASAAAAGRYRRGVFFESSAVLCFDGRTCTLIPKRSVLRIDRRPADNVESGAQALGTYIVFKGPGGRELSRHVSGAGWDGKTRMWHKSGMLPS